MTVTLIKNQNTLNLAQGTITAQEDAITLDRMPTAGGVAIELYGTWTGTVTFEALVGVNWVAFNMTPSNSGTDASTATGNGAWSKAYNGYTKVRARLSTGGTGTVGVYVRATNARLG